MGPGEEFDTFAQHQEGLLGIADTALGRLR